MKRSLCKFFAEGRCEKGDRCTWAHEESEISSEPRLKFNSGAEPKRKVCRFWQEGRCEKGDQCTFNHMDEIPEQDILSDFKLTICKFWQSGNCHKTDYCTFAHGEDEIGLLIKRPSDQPAELTDDAVSNEVHETLDFEGPPDLDEQREVPALDMELDQSAKYKKTPCKFWFQGTCHRGADCTWLHPDADDDGGDRDTGEKSDYPYVRNDDDETAEPAPTQKRTMCKYFLQGVCKNGDACTWSHGGAAALFLGQDDDEDDQFPKLEVKRTICKFWSSGHCTKGSGCTFAHGADEIGTPIEEPDLRREKEYWPDTRERARSTDSRRERQSVGRDSTSYDPYDQKRRDRRDDSRDRSRDRSRPGRSYRSDYENRSHSPSRPGHRDEYWRDDGRGDRRDDRRSCPESRDRSPRLLLAPTPRLPDHASSAGSRRMCKYWAAGSCVKGEHCDFAHLETQTDWHQRGDRYADRRERSPELRVETVVVRTMCKYWESGNCTKGNSCTFAHGEKDLGTVVRKPIAENAADIQVHKTYSSDADDRPPWRKIGGHSSEDRVRSTICRFWQQGKCEKDRGTCTFAHGEREIGSAVGTEASRKATSNGIPCKFWELGNCNKGFDCPFLHAAHLGRGAADFEPSSAKRGRYG